jgi:hypothetical protein
MPNLSDYLNTSVAGSSLPSQTGQGNKYLTTNGSNTSWQTPSLIDTLDGGNAPAFTPTLEFDGGDVNRQ